MGAQSMERTVYFKKYRDLASQWRWTLYASNNRKIADSGELYWNESDCDHAIGLLRSRRTSRPSCEDDQISKLARFKRASLFLGARENNEEKRVRSVRVTFVTIAQRTREFVAIILKPPISSLLPVGIGQGNSPPKHDPRNSGSDGDKKCRFSATTRPTANPLTETLSRSGPPRARSGTPTAAVVFRLARYPDPGKLEPGRQRHHRAEVLPQGRRPGPAAQGRGELGPARLWRSEADKDALAALPEAERFVGETDWRARSSTVLPAPGPTGAGGRLLRCRVRRARLLRRAPLHAAPPDGGAELAAVVQHRPALGLRHRRPGQGHFYVDPDGRADASRRRLRAPAAARLLHPVGHRRPGE